MMHTDLLLDYEGDPDALDATLLAMPIPCALLGGPDYVKHDGHYVARVFGDPASWKYFVEHQGYCKVLGEAELPHGRLL